MVSGMGLMAGDDDELSIAFVCVHERKMDEGVSNETESQTPRLAVFSRGSTRIETRSCTK